MNLTAETYKDKILLTKRGNNHGVFSNAKPVFVLSIIDAIAEGVIIGNKIRFDNNELEEIYRRNYTCFQNDSGTLFRANNNTTPFSMPFFHLNAESYYHIKWIGGIVPPKQAKSPSNKYLKDCVDFAYLDDELWELLQNQEIRQEYRESIIKKFLTDKY